MEQKNVKDLNDLDLALMLNETHQKLAQYQNNLQVLLAEIDKRKKVKVIDHEKQ